MNQHTFVRQCQEKYADEGAHPGDGDLWQEAHFPLPRGLGDETIWLRHDDHQVQGLLQSEEMGRRHFWNGDVSRFLKTGPFVDGWFELCDLYEKWAKDTEYPPDLADRRCPLPIYRFLKTGPFVDGWFELCDLYEKWAKDTEYPPDLAERARQAQNKRCSEERSETARKRWARISPEERSKRNKQASEKRSPEEMRNSGLKAGTTSAKVTSKAVMVTRAESGDVWLFPSVVEAERQLNLVGLGPVARGTRKQTRGHTAEFFPGPNPFFA